MCSSEQSWSELLPHTILQNIVANQRIASLSMPATWITSLVTLVFITCKVTSGEIYLEKLDSLYLPYSYSPAELYAFDKGAAEQSAYDGQNKLIYSVGRY